MRYGQPRPHGADLGEDAMRDEVKTFTQSEIIALLKIFITSSAIQAAAVEEALDWFDAQLRLSGKAGVGAITYVPRKSDFVFMGIIYMTTAGSTRGFAI